MTTDWAVPSRIISNNHYTLPHPYYYVLRPLLLAMQNNVPASSSAKALQGSIEALSNRRNFKSARGRRRPVSGGVLGSWSELRPGKSLDAIPTRDSDNFSFPPPFGRLPLGVTTRTVELKCRK